MRRFLKFLSPGSPSLVALGQFGASGLSLLSAPIVARAIGPEGRGETAAVLAVTYMWPLIIGMGLPLEVRRVAASNGDASIVRTARIWVALSFLPSLLVGGVFCLTFFSSFATPEKIAALIAISIGPLAVSWMCDQSVLISRLQYGRVAVVQVLQPAVYVAIVGAGWMLGLVTVTFVLSANAAAVVGTCCVAAMLSRVSVAGPRPPLRKTLRASLPFAGSSVTDATTNRLDQLLALPVMGGQSAGLYAVAATLGALAMPLGHALAASAFNAVARSPAEMRDSAIQARTREALALALVSSVMIVMVTPLGVPALFGDEFAGAVVPTIVCAVGGAGAIAAYVCMLSLAGARRGRAMTAAQLVRLVVAVVLLLWLGSILGPLGAAIASATGAWTLLFMLATRIRGGLRIFLVTPRDILNALRRLKKVGE